MKLNEYIPSIESGASLARKLSVPDSLVSAWKTGDRPIPAKRCPEIERATNGLVRCEDMLPDVDWAYIRSSKKRRLTKQD